MTRRIAIVVHGRFHAFDLARTLLERGQDVTVFTNYPGWAAERFGVPRRAVRSFVSHAILSRSAGALGGASAAARAERPLHALFGRWAAAEVGRERWDAVHCWSGVSEELLSAPDRTAGLTLLMRGSAHIDTQAALLAEEAARAGISIDAPSAWMTARERHEYALADHVVVLSSFARRTFVERGMPADRVSVLPLGADVGAFRPTPEVARERAVRIRRGAALRVLYVGALSYQKGWLDLLSVARALEGEAVQFLCAGPITPEVRPSLSSLSANVQILGKLPQHELPATYATADLFLFPTIQDGFGMVLAQAKTGGVPVLTTANSAGPDLVREGHDGWVVPIRRPDLLADRIRWSTSHRERLAEMAEAAYAGAAPRDWREVAAEFEALVERLLPVRSSVHS